MYSTKAQFYSNIKILNKFVVNNTNKLAVYISFEFESFTLNFDVITESHNTSYTTIAVFSVEIAYC